MMRSQICDLVVGDADDAGRDWTLQEILERFDEAQPRDERTARYLPMASRLIETFTNSYPICVLLRDAPADADIRYRVERRLYTAYRTSTTRSIMRPFRKALDWLRQFLGVASTVVSFPLRNADRCESYHLEVKGPDGTYLARQRIREVSRQVEVQLADDIPYVIRPRLVQRHSHLYIRSGRHLADKYFETHFFERVPGSVAVSALSTSAAAVLIWLCALIKLGYSGGGSEHGDIFLLALTFPTVISAWAGFEGESKVLGGTLVARTTSFLTIVLSVASAIAYVMTETYSSEGGKAVDVTDRPYFIVWVLFTSAISINLVAALGSWLLRAAVQRHFLTRAAPGA